MITSLTAEYPKEALSAVHWRWWPDKREKRAEIHGIHKICHINNMGCRSDPSDGASLSGTQLLFGGLGYPPLRPHFAEFFPLKELA